MTTETTDTREEQAERLIAEMKAARGYIYPSHEFAARQDPEFLKAYNTLVGLALLHEGVDLENRALAPKYRELVVIGILAARGGTALSHMRRAIRLGATEQEIMEVGQAAIVPRRGACVSECDVRAGAVARGTRERRGISRPIDPDRRTSKSSTSKFRGGRRPGDMEAMKFGTFHLYSKPDWMTDHDVIHSEFEQALWAEEFGFESVWIAEHSARVYGIVGAAQVPMAAIAARTEKIRIGTAVTRTALHHPLHVAEDLAYVDVISNGRLDWGIGKGYDPLEFSTYGVDYEERDERCRRR